MSFARNWPLARAKFAMWLCHPQYQGLSAEKSEACVEDVDLPVLKYIIMMYRWPFTHLLSACLLYCNRVAASRMQIVPDWPPVAFKLYLSGRQSHANFSRFYSCCRYSLHVTSGHSGTIYMRLAASCMQLLHALAVSCV